MKLWSSDEKEKRETLYDSHLSTEGGLIFRAPSYDVDLPDYFDMSYSQCRSGMKR